MNGHHISGFNGIEHPLRLVFRGIAEVEVNPQPRRGFGLGCEGIENKLIDNMGVKLNGVKINRA